MKSICDKCSSRGYCMNREKDVKACINFNKFPADKGSSLAPWDRKKHGDR